MNINIFHCTDQTKKCFDCNWIHCHWFKILFKSSKFGKVMKSCIMVKNQFLAHLTISRVNFLNFWMMAIQVTWVMAMVVRVNVPIMITVPVPAPVKDSKRRLMQRPEMVRVMVRTPKISFVSVLYVSPDLFSALDCHAIQNLHYQDWLVLWFLLNHLTITMHWRRKTLISLDTPGSIPDPHRIQPKSKHKQNDSKNWVQKWT